MPETVATPGKLIAGNWKMNGLGASLDEARAVRDGLPPGSPQVLICPPLTLVPPLSALAKGSRLSVGAQDCHALEKGAHTGDVSAPMLADAGAVAVIVGHSERRADHGETDAAVRAKAEAAVRAGLIAIVCVGETRGAREFGLTLDVVSRQLDRSLAGGALAGDTVVAYEPVWAIGTGLTATPRQVAEAHAHIRERLRLRFGGEGDAMRILYGGSVNPKNAAELLALPNVDGALVGGASLKASDFLAIIQACPAGAPAAGVR